MFELSFLSLGRFDAWPLSRFSTLLLWRSVSMALTHSGARLLLWRSAALALYYSGA